MSYQFALVKFAYSVFISLSSYCLPGRGPTFKNGGNTLLGPNLDQSDWLERKAELKTFDIVRLLKFTQNLTRYAIKTIVLQFISSGVIPSAVTGIYLETPIKRIDVNGLHFQQSLTKKHKFEINIYFMSDFLTRVELYDAKWPDEYISRLPSAMAREGFSRTITDEKGIVYELPIAEYYKSTSENIEQVLERANKAVTTTGKKFGVIVGDCTNLKWSGLTTAKK